MNPFNLPNINNQFEDVSSKYKTDFIQNNTNNLLTIIQLSRQNATDVFDSMFTFSLKLSQFADAKLITLKNRDSSQLINDLIKNISSLNSPYIYIGSSNTFISEHFFGYCLDLLLDNNTLQAVSVNSFINNDLSKDPIGSINITNSLNACESMARYFNESPDLASILSHFLFNKNTILVTLQHLLDKGIQSTQTGLDFILKNTEGLFCSPENLISSFTTSSAEKLVEQALTHFNSDNVEEAIALFNKAAVIDPNYPHLHYLLAAAKASIGNWWEAKLDLSKEVVTVANEPEISELNSILNELLPNPQPTYAQVEKSIDTVFGQLVPGQEEFLFNKVRSLPNDSTILEIGSFYGRSTVSMGFGALGSNKRIISIDTFCWNEGVIGGCNDWRNTFVYNLRRFGLDHLVTILQGYSYEHLSNWKDLPPVDMVFIDASHWYTDVINDLELVFPIVKPGGWIALHDTNPSWTGPWRAWREAGMKITDNHQYCSSISCGQKLSDTPFPLLEKSEGRSVFSYSNEIIQYWREQRPELHSILPHMSVSIEASSSKEELLSAESSILNLSESDIKVLENMAKKEGRVDGDLHYWLGLLYRHQGHIERAIESLNKSITAELPPQTTRAEELLAEICPQGYLNRPDSNQSTQVDNSTTNQMASPKDTDCLEPTLKAKRYISQKRVSEANDLLDRVIKTHSPLYELLQLKVECLNKLGGSENIASLEHALNLLFSKTNHSKEVTAIIETNAPSKPIQTQMNSKNNSNTEFQYILNIIKPYTSVPEEKLFSLFNFAKEICIGDLPGNFVECGVSAGGSSALLAYVIKNYSRRPRILFACDTFEGSSEFISLMTQTPSLKFKTQLECLKEATLIVDASHIVTTIKGLFGSTLEKLKTNIGKIALLHVNCDQGTQTKIVFNYLYSNITQQGVVQINENNNWDNVKKTLDEFKQEQNVQFNINKVDESSLWFQKL